MTTIRKLADGPARRALEPRKWPRPPGLALLTLALVGLVQSGCRSDGCSTCGLGNSISTSFSNGVQALGNGVRSVGSIFHHKKGCGGGGDCGCEGGFEEGGVVVDQGIPVMPGAMSMPASGAVMPAPAIESEVPQLKPLDSPNPTSGTGTSGATPLKSSTSRSTPAGSSTSNYTTSLPRNKALASKGSQADQSLAKSSNRPGDANPAVDPFESIIIPPVDMPSAVTRQTVPAITPAVTPSSTTSPSPVAPTSAEKVSAADGVLVSLPSMETVAAPQAPGLRRFASIAPSVAGGSAPSVEGLDWLKEKGYRTLLDLRKGSEIDPNFADAVNDRGMTYISLPIMANHLDPNRLARFDDHVSRTENRPLFFCDTDGSRAAIAWYIHQRIVAQEDPQSARTKAEELGLGSAEAKLAEDYIASQKPRARAAMAKVAMANPTPEPIRDKVIEATSPPALPEAPDPPVKAISPVTPQKFEEAIPGMLPGEDRPQASVAPSPIYYRDPTAWKPVAALVLTGVGVPLAFWSRSMLSEYRHVRRRASLPGAKPRSLDAPAGSDA